MRYYCRNTTFLLILLSALTACGSFTKPSTTLKPTILYDPGKASMHPDYLVYHSGEEESTLFFRVFANELVFNQANPETRDQARIRIDIKLYSSYSDQILDLTKKKEFKINKDESDIFFINSLKFKTEQGKSYLAEILLTDLIREKSHKDFVFVDRFSSKTQQNYLLLSYPGSQVAFERYFYAEESIRIVSPNLQGDAIRIAYYPPIKTMPRPPFSTEDSKPSSMESDSIWTIPFNDMSLIRFEREGIYYVMPDTSDLNGFYLTRFSSDFPQIRSAEDLLPPLQYITKREEYMDMVSAKDLKKAVDEFWIEKAGDYARARELIKVFYNRVVFSNLYFTSDRPGWKTDRGMIYLMMGPPQQVIKSETGEDWIYHNTEVNRKFRFSFYLATNPLTGYNFALKRTEDHRNVWNTAVNRWREGKIFSL